MGIMDLADKKRVPEWDVDSEWFFDRLKERKLSLRGMAKLMDMSPSSLSLRFGGTYKITMEEAVVMASLLGATFEEIVHRAGIKVPKDPSRSIRLIGVVAGVTIKTGRGLGVIDRPGPLPAGAVAIKGVEPGWVYFYSPSQKLQPEAVNQLSVVEGVPSSGAKGGGGGPKGGAATPKSSTETWLGVLERGSRGGVWNVRGVFGGGVEGVKVLVATPVLVILP